MILVRFVVAVGVGVVVAFVGEVVVKIVDPDDVQVAWNVGDSSLWDVIVYVVDFAAAVVVDVGDAGDDDDGDAGDDYLNVDLGCFDYFDDFEQLLTLNSLEILSDAFGIENPVVRAYESLGELNTASGQAAAVE